MSLINVRMGTRAKGTKSGGASGGGASATNYYALTAGSADWAERAGLALELDPAAKILENLLKADALASLLVPVLQDGTELPISRAAEAHALKAKVGFYSEEFISAHGLNDASAPVTPGATTLGDLTDVTLTAVQNGQALVYENGQWVNKAIGGGLDEAALGAYLTNNNYAKKSDIPSNYVTLDTAQPITGLKTISVPNSVGNGLQATLNSHNQGGVWVDFKTSGTQRLSVGWFNGFTNLSSTPGYTGGADEPFYRLGITDSGVPQFWTDRDANKYDLLHAGNYASQLDSRYAVKNADENITGFWTFYAHPQVYAGAGAWAYERFNCGGDYWDIATTDTAAGVMDANALEFRKNGLAGAGMFLRWVGSSLGKLCIVSETTESSIGYYDRSDLSKPKWTVGTQIGGDYCFGWWASGPNYGPGCRMTLSERGLLSIRSIHGPILTIGAQNSSFIHYSNDYGVPHWFAQDIRVAGNLYAGPGYDQLVWHAGNDGSGSGLDADLLDGVHNGDLTAKLINGSNPIYSSNITTPGFYFFDGNPANISDGSPTPGGTWNFSMIVLGNIAARTKQLAINYNEGRIFTRTCTDSWSGWNAVAFVSDNVASASKLATARNIWGNSFNGEGDINGTLDGVQNIYGNYPNGNPGYLLYKGLASDEALRIDIVNADGSWKQNGLFLKSDGNLGVGTPYASEKLSVNGWVGTWNACGWYNISYQGGIYMIDSTWIRTYNNKRFYCDNVIRSDARLEVGEDGSAFYASSNGTVFASAGVWSNGYISAHGQNTSSDARLKYILDPVTLDIRKIADAPSVRFRWLKENEEDAGSIAQYWQEHLPWTVRRQPNGYLGLDYGRAALLSAISIAKTVTRHEDRLNALEAECRQLREENAKLRNELQTLKQYN